MMQPSTNVVKHRFEVLDIFRGLFAFTVVFFHLKTILITPIVQNSFISNGFLFVDFFFALSGFVIAYNYLDKINNYTDLKQFLVKRFYRLYPLYFATLLFFTVYVLLRLVLGFHFKAGVTTYTLKTFFINLFLLNSVHFPGVNSLSWNTPSWSISAEAIAYTVFATFTLLINKLKLASISVIFWILLLSASVLGAYSYFNGIVDFTATFNNGFLRGIIGFISGVITQILFKNLITKINRSYFILFSLLEILAFLLIIFSVSLGSWGIKYGLVYEVIFCISILIFSFEKGIVSKKLNSISLLKKIGMYSYSIYMIHNIIIVLMDSVTKKFTGENIAIDTIVCLITIIIVYFASKWTYKNVELIFYNRKKTKTNS